MADTPHTCDSFLMAYQGVRELNGHQYEVWKCPVCGYERHVPTEYFCDTEWRR